MKKKMTGNEYRAKHPSCMYCIHSIKYVIDWDGSSCTCSIRNKMVEFPTIRAKFCPAYNPMGYHNFN